MTLDQASQQWLLEAIRFYRPLEFFRDFEGRSDRETAEELAELYRRAWDAEIDPASELAELELLALDDSRVWWEDTAAGWSHGDGTWEWVLDGWSRISRGAFRPTGIEERWRQGGDGQTAVRFTVGGRPLELHPKQANGALDLNVLFELNLYLKSTALRFEMVESFDETAYLLVLRGEEKARMESRGWRFQ